MPGALKKTAAITYKGKAMIEGYVAVRPLSDEELAALRFLARGAALRFFLTRLYDWLTTPAGALVVKKDPLENLRKLRISRQGAVGGGLRIVCMKHIEIFTDGACTGNPGPAAGRYSALRREGAGTAWRRGRDHQQPHGTDGRYPGAGRLKEACEVDLYTDSAYVKDGISKWIFGWRKTAGKTADKKP